jgi:hypothetical protein
MKYHGSFNAIASGRQRIANQCSKANPTPEACFDAFRLFAGRCSDILLEAQMPDSGVDGKSDRPRSVTRRMQIASRHNDIQHDRHISRHIDI